MNSVARTFHLAPLPVREIIMDPAPESCPACGATLADHYGVYQPTGRKFYVGHPRPERNPGMSAKQIARLERAASLAGVISALTAEEPLSAHHPDEQRRRVYQAVRVLAEHEPAALAVAQHRGFQVLCERLGDLLLGRSLSGPEREAVKIAFRAGLLNYEASLEGLLGEPKPSETQKAGA